MAYKAMVSEWIGYVNLVRSDPSEISIGLKIEGQINMPRKTRLSYKKNYERKRQVEYVHTCYT